MCFSPDNRPPPFLKVPSIQEIANKPLFQKNDLNTPLPKREYDTYHHPLYEPKKIDWASIGYSTSVVNHSDCSDWLERQEEERAEQSRRESEERQRQEEEERREHEREEKREREERKQREKKISALNSQLKKAEAQKNYQLSNLSSSLRHALGCLQSAQKQVERAESAIRELEDRQEKCIKAFEAEKERIESEISGDEGNIFSWNKHLSSHDLLSKSFLKPAKKQFGDVTFSKIR